MNRSRTPGNNLSAGHLSRIVIAWVIFLVIVSLQPLRPGVTRNSTLAHLLLHILVFGFTALLFQLPTRPTSARAVWPWKTALGTLCLATGIEAIQHMIYRHKFEWQDFWADALGIALATLPGGLLLSRGRHDSAEIYDQQVPPQ